MVNRITPALPAAAMKTYAVVAPRATHFRPATCQEVDCPNYLAGWLTVVDEATELGRSQAAYIRERSGRRFTEAQQWDSSGLTEFTFEAGQECFAQHEAPLERDPLYLVKGGDWRGNPAGTLTRVHQRPEDWVEDMQESLDRTRKRVEG